LCISVFCEYKIVNSQLDYKKKIFCIFFISAILRMLWLLNTNNVPNSDFATMYYSAGEFLDGKSDVFKGISYGGRFPHLIVTMIYMALMRYVFPQYNIIAMKIVNLMFGMITLGVLYEISKEIFKEKKYSFYVLCLGSIFPPFITYTAVFCGENLAMPFYLLSIYLFTKNINTSKTKSFIFILSSLSLGIGNLLRMIAGVILIAYVMYIMIYCQERIAKRLKYVACLILPYVLVIVLTSACLQKMNITENPLWRGTEPKITSVLKGSNINSLGMWNVEDAEIGEKYKGDYDKIESECEKVIYERLTTTSPIRLAVFYVQKLGAQWCIGDFSGSLWTQKDMPDDKMIFKIGTFGSMPFQLIYLGILIMTLIGLRERYMNNNPVMSLMYLILCGYIAVYLITENQCRYGYIVCWIFIIFGTDGIRKYLSVKEDFSIHTENNIRCEYKSM
ncbi:MAG: glycosyltransferase family 39 protein, partial [Clostridium sp.]|nr:glycosyltransferase family 39 protein [Clostridium sp.]